ncbi:MAG: asparaginase domain-containing protein [Bdellovibrionota bacterium]|nr:asparaginase [Pseudobdellovibrionaceae bacterium]|tara:strand:+ start:15259 stop:15771 length:513 start_codon:yes stop_codon:yes gene_type:complete
MKKKLTVLTTGGTIEKVYDESDGALKNGPSIFRENILNHLRLPNYEISVYEVFSKDSLDIDDQGREFLKQAVELELSRGNPILVIHGTDTMTHSAEYCQSKISDPPVPIVFTGAMKPTQLRDTDALQNVAGAISSIPLLAPGFYISFHGETFLAGTCQKNKKTMSFESIS